MEWFESMLLGLVQGLTEFLPVSSSGHLAIGKALLGVEPSGDLIFEVTVHAATVLATIVVFRKEIWKLLCGVKREHMAQFSFLMVLVPILGETFLDLVGGEMTASTVGTLPLLIGFVAAFISGLFACKVMIALVRKAQLKWFGLYCALVGLAVLIWLA